MHNFHDRVWCYRGILFYDFFSSSRKINLLDTKLFQSLLSANIYTLQEMEKQNLPWLIHTYLDTYIARAGTKLSENWFYCIDLYIHVLWTPGEHLPWQSGNKIWNHSYRLSVIRLSRLVNISVVYQKHDFWLYVTEMKLFEGEKTVLNHRIHFGYRVYGMVTEAVWCQSLEEIKRCHPWFWLQIQVSETFLV